MKKSRTTTKKACNNPRYTLKWLVASLIGFIALATPLVVVFLVNRKDYFDEHTSSVTIGLIVLVLVAFLQMKQYTKKFNSVVWLAIVELLLVCFKSILGDAILIVAMALIGRIAYYPCSIFIARYDRFRKAYDEGKIQQQLQRENIDYAKSQDWR